MKPFNTDPEWTEIYDPLLAKWLLVYIEEEYDFIAYYLPSGQPAFRFLINEQLLRSYMDKFKPSIRCFLVKYEQMDKYIRKRLLLDKLVKEV